MPSVGATCVGLDPCHDYIKNANQLKAASPELNLEFHHGRHLSGFAQCCLPDELSDAADGGPRKYTHVFSQQALWSCHEHLALVLHTVAGSLCPGGLLVLNDCVGCDMEASEDQAPADNDSELRVLLGHKSWRKTVDEAGFTILYYENLDSHVDQSHEDWLDMAQETSSVMAQEMAHQYAASLQALQVHQLQQQHIGMNLVVLSK